MFGWDALEVPLGDCVEPKTARLFARAGVKTVAELLTWFPRRYVPRTELSHNLQADEGETVLFVGTVIAARAITTRNRKHMYTLTVDTDDPTAAPIAVTYFNAFVPQRELTRGTRALFMGTLSTYRGQWQLTHPDYVIMPDEEVDTNEEMDDNLPLVEALGSASGAGEEPSHGPSAPPTLSLAANSAPGPTAPLTLDLAGKSAPSTPAQATQENSTSPSSPEASTAALSIAKIIRSLEMIPIYPTKTIPLGNKGRTQRITSWQVLETMLTVLTQLPPIEEPLPAPPTHPATGKPMLTLDNAIRAMHMPDSWAHATAARQRLAMNEALGIQAAVQLRRRKAHRRLAPACDDARIATNGTNYQQQLLAGLPYQLTDGQKKAVEEITHDMATETPMTRLVQGDVGSGKTLVALLAMLRAIDAGRQAAMLAPTEVLAYQHARSLTNLLSAAAVPATVAVLTGSHSDKAKQEVLLGLVSGQIDMVIGTHALLSDNVEFFDLGLVVIDEQHRFGVEQRAQLRSAGRLGPDGTPLTPHQLVMTATPIPRTIALTVFGDLDVSTIRELPRGRQPIRSAVVPEFKPSWVQRAYQRICEEIGRGRQAYVVCPRIEGDGGVEQVFQFLKAGVFATVRVGMLHGRMAPAEKDAVMTSFVRGELDVLVSTTVIEVGVDVPNATIMLIREAERFGLSQLHQLRGRVGRGTEESWCFFHTAQEEGSEAVARLEKVAEVRDGFALAELDLVWRSEGDVLGSEQSGRASRLTFLNVTSDGELIAAARDQASALCDSHPEVARRLAASLTESQQDHLDVG